MPSEEFICDFFKLSASIALLQWAYREEETLNFIDRN